MLILTRYTPEGWTVDENTANLIPELRALLADKTLGVKALAFVALAKDPTSFLFTIYDEDDIRISQAFVSVFEKGDPEKIVDNKLVKVAMEKYFNLCNTAGYKMRNQYREGIRYAASQIEAMKGKKMSATGLTNYLNSLGKMPQLIQQYDEMAKGDQADIEQAKKVIRGGRELTYLERRNSAKRKSKK